MSEDKVKDIIMFNNKPLRKDYASLTLEEVQDEMLLRSTIKKKMNKINKELREHHLNLNARMRTIVNSDQDSNK